MDAIEAFNDELRDAIEERARAILYASSDGDNDAATKQAAKEAVRIIRKFLADD